MNDDRFNQYRTNATDNQKALELTKQGQQFESDIEALKANQQKLDGKYDKLGKELGGKSDEDIARDREGFHKLKEEYVETGIEAEANREALKQKEKEYKDFKEHNTQNSLAQEATQQDVNKTYDEQTFGEDGAKAGLTANRYTDSPDTPGHGNGAGDASQSHPNNDPRLDQARQKAFAQAKEVGKDLAQKQKEQQPDKDQDDDR